MVILTSSAGVQAPRALLCTGPQRGGCRRADRRQLRQAGRAPHRRRPDAGLRQMGDAFAALAHLRADPRIDPNRIGVMGVSKGGVATLNTAIAVHREPSATAPLPSSTCMSRSCPTPPSTATPRRTARQSSRCWPAATTTRRRRWRSSTPSACAPRASSIKVKVYASAHHGLRSLGRCSASRTPRTSKSCCRSFIEDATAATSSPPPTGDERARIPRPGRGAIASPRRARAGGGTPELKHGRRPTFGILQRTAFPSRAEPSLPVCGGAVAVIRDGVATARRPAGLGQRGADSSPADGGARTCGLECCKSASIDARAHCGYISGVLRVTVLAALLALLLGPFGASSSITRDILSGGARPAIAGRRPGPGDPRRRRARTSKGGWYGLHPGWKQHWRRAAIRSPPRTVRRRPRPLRQRPLDRCRANTVDKDISIEQRRGAGGDPEAAMTQPARGTARRPRACKGDYPALQKGAGGVARSRPTPSPTALRHAEARHDGPRVTCCASGSPSSRASRPPPALPGGLPTTHSWPWSRPTRRRASSSMASSAPRPPFTCSTASRRAYRADRRQPRRGADC